MGSGFLLIAFGFILMAVCTTATGQIPPGKESGIEGIITVSPAKPGPTRIDAPGSVPLANATFVVATKMLRLHHLLPMRRDIFEQHYRQVITKFSSTDGRPALGASALRSRRYAGEGDKRSMGV